MFDHSARPRCWWRSDAPTTRTTYDWRDQPLTETDAAGVVTRHSYDLAGQRLTQTQAEGTSAAGTTSTVYDLLGQPVAVTDPNGQTTHDACHVVGCLTPITADRQRPATVVG